MSAGLIVVIVGLIISVTVAFLSIALIVLTRPRKEKSAADAFGDIILCGIAGVVVGAIAAVSTIATLALATLLMLDLIGIMHL